MQVDRSLHSKVVAYQMEDLITRELLLCIFWILIDVETHPSKLIVRIKLRNERFMCLLKKRDSPSTVRILGTIVVNHPEPVFAQHLIDVFLRFELNYRTGGKPKN